MAIPLQKKKMLGEMLIAEGIITRDQQKKALAEQKLMAVGWARCPSRHGLCNRRRYYKGSGQADGHPTHEP